MPTQNQLTKILHAQVKQSKSGLSAKEIADLLGKPYPTFMLELGSADSHKLDANLILPIMKLTESDVAINFLARELGGVYIPIGNAFDTNKVPELTKATLKCVTEFGEFLAEIAPSIEDGIINQKEYNKILKEGHEALTAITSVLETVRQLHETQYGHLYDKK